MTTPHRVLRVAFAIALPLLTTGVLAVIDNPSYHLGFVYIALVVLVSMVVGWRLATVSAAIGLAGFWWAVLPPANSWELVWPNSIVAMAGFVAAAAAVLWLVARYDATTRANIRLERRYRRLADAGIVGAIFWNVSGPITEANDAFLAMVGYDRDDLRAGRIDWRAMTPPEYAATDEIKVAEMDALGAHGPYEKEYYRKDGTRVPLLVASAYLDQDAGDGTSFMVDLSEQWAARAEADAANRRLSLIVEASSALLQATSADDVLQHMVDALVGRACESAVAVVPDGSLLTVAAAASVHHTPGMASLVGSRVHRAKNAPLAAAMETGVAQPTGDSPGGGSGFAIPLRSRRGILGVVEILAEEGISDAEIPTLQDVADRAASVYLNALEYQGERSIAKRLQEALLPPSIPMVRGHDVGVVYLPASSDRGVGGDWWDVVDLGNDKVALVIGDVSGHGVTTAAVMAEIRNALRGFLTLGLRPAAALTATAGMLVRTNHREHATVFVGLFDGVTRTLTYSNAGHPPPLLVAGGHGRVLEGARSTPVGFLELERVDAEIALPHTFDLLLYTDGLVEARASSIDVGIDALCSAAVRMSGDGTAQERAEKLVANATWAGTDDDTCLLVFSRS